MRTVPIAVLLLTATAAAQDWHEAVAKAHEHPRYAMRRAVASRIAKAGDDAVPALLAYEEEHGRDRISLLVVEAIAASDADGERLTALLTEWATDREFYWRSQALSGLARRGTEAARPLFAAAVEDPAHLYRIAGAEGLLRLDPADARARALLGDPDPRVRYRVARLLGTDDDAALRELCAATGRAEHEFLGDPWGRRDAEDAGRRLAERADVEPEPAYRPTDGVEIRSCRNGDLFVGLFADRIRFGIDGSTVIETDRAGELRAELAAALPDDGVLGTVVCDYVRARTTSVEKHVKAAPGAAPAALLEWLNALAAVVEEAGNEDLAREIRARLPQFTEPSEK